MFNFGFTVRSTVWDGGGGHLDLGRGLRLILSS